MVGLCCWSPQLVYICDLRIVSDANNIFIDTILDHLGIKDCFSEINTNPSYRDNEGMLRIFPYVDFKSSPHGCNNSCSPNMCKGMILERIKCSVAKEGKKRMIYLGDGIGDFCPKFEAGVRRLYDAKKELPNVEFDTRKSGMHQSRNP